MAASTSSAIGKDSRCGIVHKRCIRASFVVELILKWDSKRETGGDETRTSKTTWATTEGAARRVRAVHAPLGGGRRDGPGDDRAARGRRHCRSPAGQTQPHRSGAWHQRRRCLRTGRATRCQATFRRCGRTCPPSTAGCRSTTSTRSRPTWPALPRNADSILAPSCPLAKCQCTQVRENERG